MSTLEIKDHKSTLETVEAVSSVDILEIQQVLDINQQVSNLEITHTEQKLEIVETQPPILEIIEQPATLEIVAPSVIIHQGEASSLQLIAGEAIGGHRAVIAINGEAFHASSDDLTHIGRHIGISTSAASQGASVNVRFSGEISESSWNWQPGPIYVGINGLLTQTKPAIGWIVNIGIALNTTKLLINPQMSIQVT